jgi:NACalpha-BTF3-like transcription factor
MDESKKVAFCDGTKPPCDEKIKSKQLDEEDIRLIMLHAKVTRNVAIKAYVECEEDLVNAILSIKN